MPIATFAENTATACGPAGARRERGHHSLFLGVQHGLRDDRDQLGLGVLCVLVVLELEVLLKVLHVAIMLEVRRDVNLRARVHRARLTRVRGAALSAEGLYRSQPPRATRLVALGPPGGAALSAEELLAASLALLAANLAEVLVHVAVMLEILAEVLVVRRSGLLRALRLPSLSSRSAFVFPFDFVSEFLFDLNGH